MHDPMTEQGGHSRRDHRFASRFERFAREMGEQLSAGFGAGVPDGFAASATGDYGRGGPRRGGAGRSGEGGFGGGGDGGPRNRGRVFDSAELRLVLLKLVEDTPRHGYELIKEIEARSGGVYAPSPGMVYPTLTLIADLGQVDEIPEGSRKRFAITHAGRKVLVAEARGVAEAMARLDALARLRAPTDAATIRRAMRNLHSAVHDRLAQEGTDAAATRTAQFDVAAILDEAARRIERL